MIIRPSADSRPATASRAGVSAVPAIWLRYRDRALAAPGLRVNFLLWLLLLLTNITDVLASRYALARGAVELNPNVAVLLEAHGISGLVLFKGLWLVLLLLLLPYIKGWLQWLYGFVSLAYLLLSAYHLYHI